MTLVLRVAGTVFLLILFIVSPTAAQTWQMTHAGTTAPWSVAADSSGEKIIAATPISGYWISLDGGANWNPWNHSISYNMMYESTSIQAFDSAADTLLVFCYLRSSNELDFHSYNGGVYWSSYHVQYDWPGGLPSPSRGAWEILPAPVNRVYYACYSGFARTENNGSSWQITNITHLTDDVNGMLVKPDNPDEIFVYGGWVSSDAQTDEPSGGILYSQDAGTTWSLAANMSQLTAGAEGEITDLTMLPNGDLVAVAVWTDTPQPYLMLVRSVDGGFHWHWYPYQGLPDRFVAHDIEVVPEVPGRLLLTGSNDFGMWTSDDAGLTWQRMLNGLPDRPMAGAALYRNEFSGQLYVSFREQGLYRSDDYGDTWTALSNPPAGVSVGLNEDMPSNSTGTIYNTYYGSTWFADVNSDQFVEIKPEFNPDYATFLNGFTLPDGRIGYLNRETELFGNESLITIMLSDDAGQTWSASETSAIPEHLSFPEIQSFVQGEDTVLVGKHSYSDRGYVSHDLGDSWDEVVWDPRQLGPIHQVRGSYFAHDPEMIDIYRSSEIGPFWESTEFPREDFLSEGCLKILSHEDYLLLAAGYTFWEFNPDDQWVLRSYQNPTPIAWDLVVADIDTFLVAMFLPEQNYGLRVSDNLGYLWYPIDVQYPWPQQSIETQDIWFDHSKQRLYLDSGVGLAYLDVNDTSVDEPWIFQPVEFDVVTVYPNPFNAQTTIHYALPHPSEIKLEVFDVLGRHVTTLVDGAYPAGTYETTFDGLKYASGTYYLKYTAGGQSFERKLVLMK